MTHSETAQPDPRSTGAPRPGSDPAPAIRVCPGCGQENAGWRRFCTGCDFDMDPARKPERMLASFVRLRPRPAALPAPGPDHRADPPIGSSNDAAPPQASTPYSRARARAKAIAEHRRLLLDDRRSRRQARFRAAAAAFAAAPTWVMHNRLAGLGFIFAGATIVFAATHVATRPDLPQLAASDGPDAATVLDDVAPPASPTPELTKAPEQIAPETRSERARFIRGPTPARSARLIRIHRTRHMWIHRTRHGWPRVHAHWRPRPLLAASHHFRPRYREFAAYARERDRHYLIHFGPLRLIRLDGPPLPDEHAWRRHHRRLRRADDRAAEAMDTPY